MRASRLVALSLILAGGRLAAQETLPAAQRASIDSAVAEVLSRTGAPSASIAVVRDGRLAYVKAYGSAHLSPPMPATTEMRYSIGSVSKQFTAAAILLLVEEKKMSLDDKVGAWFPDLTRAQDITVRDLLSMRSGYQDYWPQDYVFPQMLEPISAQGIATQWAKKPLDFIPRSKWQYSNTNYVIAGMIAEKVSGKPLIQFMKERIFTPLGMTTAGGLDSSPLGDNDPIGYLTNALGPKRVAPKEAKGWLFAAGELAMTARDLAKWDIAMIDRTALKAESYRAMQTDAGLLSGVSTRYGLGVSVNMVNGRRQIAHGGAVSGFVTRNEVYPEDKTAIVALANFDASDASGQIAGRIADIVFTATDAATSKALAQAKQIFADLQKGRITRTLFTSNANAYFTSQVIEDFRTGLAPLGTPTEFVQTGQGLRGGMDFRTYRVRAGGKTLNLVTRALPDGRLEQYQISRTE